MTDGPRPDRPRLGGAYEIAPDGALRRVGGTVEPPMPGPAEADGAPIGRGVPPALPELGPNAPIPDPPAPPAGPSPARRR
jgi:hypothetical protein